MGISNRLILPSKKIHETTPSPQPKEWIPIFVFMFMALTIGQLCVEQQMVKAVCEVQAKIPVLRNRTSFSEFHMNFVVVNLGFSLMLSLVLATMFPAAGMIVLTSGLVSTMLSRIRSTVGRGSRAKNFTTR